MLFRSVRFVIAHRDHRDFTHRGGIGAPRRIRLSPQVSGKQPSQNGGLIS
jgi:hypothetical protein